MIGLSGFSFSIKSITVIVAGKVEVRQIQRSRLKRLHYAQIDKPAKWFLQIISQPTVTRNVRDSAIDVTVLCLGVFMRLILTKFSQ